MRSAGQWILLLLCMLTACKNPNTPEQTAAKFLNSLYNYDFEMAKSLSTRNTWSILNIMDARTKDIPDEVKQENVGKLKINITRTVQETDSTYIVYYTTEPDFQIFPALRILKLEDEDGKPRYRIDISSLDSLSGGNDAFIEEEILPIRDDDSVAAESDNRQ